MPRLASSRRVLSLPPTCEAASVVLWRRSTVVMLPGRATILLGATSVGETSCCCMMTTGDILRAAGICFLLLLFFFFSSDVTESESDSAESGSDLTSSSLSSPLDLCSLSLWREELSRACGGGTSPFRPRRPKRKSFFFCASFPCLHLHQSSFFFFQCYYP